MQTVRIYALCDPDTGAARYVGKTWQTLAMRLQQHVARARRHSEGCARERWIAELLGGGKRPRISLLEEVSPEQWRAKEQEWADRCRAEGADLLNEAPPGGGGTRSHLGLWTPELDARLGVVADAVIAEELGLTRKSVTYRRRVLGIEASGDRARNVPPPPMGGWNRKEVPPNIIGRLGTVPDYRLAAECGLSKKRIARARHARGIASYAEQTGNRGTFAPGHYPERWKKRGEQRGPCEGG